jgi:hypothetical protein
MVDIDRVVLGLEDDQCQHYVFYLPLSEDALMHPVLCQYMSGSCSAGCRIQTVGRSRFDSAWGDML